MGRATDGWGKVGVDQIDALIPPCQDLERSMATDREGREEEEHSGSDLLLLAKEINNRR